MCVTVPTESLDALEGVTDSLLLAVLGQSITFMQGELVDEEGELAEELGESIDGHFEVPDDAIDKVVGNDKFVEMSKHEYTSLKAWMDSNHPSWVKNCGLVQHTDESSGKLEWRPPNAKA